MKTKNERVYYYPYEYKLFEQHFQDMAQRGWQLLDIIDHNYYVTLQYVKCEPQTLYYYTDFCGDMSYFLLGEASNKANKYTTFVEDYGYHFVAGRKGLMVYVSEEKKSIALREESEETRRLLKRASYKSVIYPFLLMSLWFALFIANVLSFIPFSIYNICDNLSFARLIQSFAMFAILFLIFLPVVFWRIRGKISYSFQRLRSRFYWNVFGLFVFVSSVFFTFNTNMFYIVLCFLFLMFIILLVWDHIQDKNKRNMLLFVVIAIFLVYMFALMLSNSVDNSQSDATKGSFTAEQLQLPSNVKIDVYHQSSLLMSKEDASVYVDTSEEGYIGSYEIYAVKDTFLQNYIVSHIPYERVATLKVEETKDYTIYMQEEKIMIQQGRIFIRFDRSLYELLNETQCRELLEEAHNQYDV